MSQWVGRGPAVDEACVRKAAMLGTVMTVGLGALAFAESLAVPASASPLPGCMAAHDRATAP